MKSQENHEQTFEKGSKPLPPKYGKEITNSLGMKFLYIQPGQFMMGSPKNEHGRSNNQILHEVTLTKGFLMQTTQVTVGQWRKFAEEYKTEAEIRDGAYGMSGKEWKKSKDFYWDNPGFKQNDDYPVTCVTWNDTQAFIIWLNEKESMNKYRLPTEAEWEYSARAGTTTAYCFGKEQRRLGQYAWYCRNSGNNTHPVGKLLPNAWGLYDMHGNVWEWCQDWYSAYPSHSVKDPKGPDKGSYRLLLGGAWESSPFKFGWDIVNWLYVDQSCRSAYRNYNDPAYRSSNVGFRILREA